MVAWKEAYSGMSLDLVSGFISLNIFTNKKEVTESKFVPSVHDSKVMTNRLEDKYSNCEAFNRLQ